MCVPPMAQCGDILVLGDSLSAGYGIDTREGWVWQLQERLREKGYPHRVVNASISGDTTKGGLARLPRALATHEPEVVIVELGANDGLRGMDLAETRGNLDRMLSLAQAGGARALLLGMKLPPNYGRRYTERFHNVYLDLARERSVALVPFFLEGVAQDPSLMQADGIHPNELGQERMLENVWPVLEELLQ